jgi:putative ABC transport system substrate-binding protein
VKVATRLSLICIALCVSLFALRVTTHAQQPNKTFRIGYLSAFDAVSESGRAEGVRLALAKLGYVEGRNIMTEYRYADGKRERYSDLAAELVQLKVDVIVLAGGLIPIQVTKNATKTVPIVMTGGGADPVKTGLVESLARPGGNVTGITNLVTDLSGKRLELLKESAPKLARVAFLYDPDVPSGRQARNDVTAVAHELGLTIRPWEIGARTDFATVSAALNKARPEGLYASDGLAIRASGKRIAAFALKNRLPSMFADVEAVHSGGLMYYGADLAHSYQRIASYVDRILRGAKPADLPIEQSTKFELVINFTTAKQIGLTIPPHVLARADRVIK